MPRTRQGSARPPVGRRRPSMFRTLAFFTILLLAGASADAAGLRGRLTDPDGRSVARAHVWVTSTSGLVATAVSDETGHYSLPQLPPGAFEVRADAEGLAAVARPLVLTSDETRDLDLALQLRALSETVVVSADTVETPLASAPASMSVVTTADLRAEQIDTVAGALRLVPGLTVTQSGTRGGVTSLFPRGGTSNYTLVLIDGLPANAFGGGYDFAHLPAGDVERIEVVRGPQSALFGAGAIGSVVQVVTRRGGPLAAGGSIEAGTERSARYTAGANGASGPWSFGGSVERSTSDGFTGSAPAIGERVTNDDDRLQHGSGSVGWQHPAGVSVVSTARWTTSERGAPGPYGSNPIGVFAGVDRISRGTTDHRQLGLQVLNAWSPDVRQRVDVGDSRLDGAFQGAFGDSVTGTHRINLRVQEDWSASPLLSVSGGIAVERETGTSTYVTGLTGQPIPIDRWNAGYFAEARLAPASRVSVAVGLRVEQIRRDGLEASPSVFSPRPAFAAQSVNSANPKLAVSWLAAGDPASPTGTTTRLRATVGTGIRPPDVFEIGFTDNPNLRPERSRSADLGVEQTLLGGRVAVGATGFFNRYTDLIVTVGRAIQGASQYTSDNISNARARGLEFTASARPLVGLALRGSYTFLATEILPVDGLATAAGPFTPGDPLIRRPRHQASFDATWARGPVTSFVTLQGRGRALDVEPNYGTFGGLFPVAGYGVLNAGASVRVARRLEIFARATNLLDRQYEETLGYPALGRAGMAGVRVTTGR